MPPRTAAPFNLARRVRSASARPARASWRRWLLCTGAAGLLLASATSGRVVNPTIDVNRTDDPDPTGLACAGVANDCSLRAAVIKANTTPGADTIDLPAGVYTLSRGVADDDFDFLGANPASGDLDIFDNDGDSAVSDLTIVGAGSGSTIIAMANAIDGKGIDRIFDVENVYGSPSAEGLNFTLTGVTLVNGNARAVSTSDGPFYESGGAINFDGCHFVSTDCASRGVLTLTDVVLQTNTAAGSGGGILAQHAGGIALNNVRFDSNQALNGAGGAVFHEGSFADGSISIASSTFTNNQAPGALAGSGGALRLGAVASLSTVAITDTTFSGNVSGITGGLGGGAISIENAKAVTITGGSFTSNKANANGGAIFSNANLGSDLVTLSGVDLRSNTADFDHTGGGDGGAVFVYEGEMLIANSLVRENVAARGAGVAAVGTLGNPKLTIRNSTLSGNLAAGLGGAVLFDNGLSGTATLLNDTIAANQANTANAGGTGFGGGLARLNGSVTLQNTILAGNTSLSSGTGVADDGKASAGVTAGSSLIQTTTNFTFANSGSITGQSPRLGPLQDNGGALPTYGLLVGSPALDAGDNTLASNAGLTTDQRGTGFARVLDAADANTTPTVDIGAYEAEPAIEEIPAAMTDEDAQKVVTFNVGDAGLGQPAITVTASSSNTALLPNDVAHVMAAVSGSTGTLTLTPVANLFGMSTMTVTVTATVHGTTQSMTDMFLLTVRPVADQPGVTNATTEEDTQSSTGLVVTRNPVDGAEVTHFKLSGITNGTLFKHDGTTPIANNTFITFAEANAGLKFTPAADKFSPVTTPFSFVVQGATDSSGSGLGIGATATITVNPIADTPSVTAATTRANQQTTSGLVITRNAVDGSEVNNFKIINITNGALFQNDGTTGINPGDFITVAQGGAGLKFTPTAGGTATGGFDVAASLDNVGTGISPAAHAAITVNKHTTTTTIVSDDPDPSSTHTPYTVVVHVASTTGGPVPTGSVSVSDGTNICTIDSLNGSGNGQCALTPAIANTYTVTAAYSGDAVSIVSSGTAGHIVGEPALGVGMSFVPSTVAEDTAAGLTITLTNASATAISGVSFTDTYPANLVTASVPGASTTCGGVVTAGPGGVSLSAGAIAGSSSCAVTVHVSSSHQGAYTNTIAAGAVTSTNAPPNGDPASATLVVNGPTQARMALDVPVNGAVLKEGAPLVAGGWALDLGAGSGIGVDAVHVWVFPIVNGSLGSAQFLGVAALGSDRPDVGTAFGDQFRLSGWALAVGGLPAGHYRLIAYAHSTVTGTFNDQQVADLTVVAPVSSPVMVLDLPPTGTTVGAASWLVVGWAIDAGAPTGVGVDAVHVWAYPITGAGLGTPTFVGAAGLGIPRADVADVAGAQFADAGFLLPVTGLAPGHYLLVAYARSTVSGTFNQSAMADVTLDGGLISDPWMAVDTPQAEAVVSLPMLISGWAGDLGAVTGPAVDAVHVWARRVSDGALTFAGAAAYGSTRADVGAIFGATFTNSGFNLSVTGLAPDTYDLLVYARSTLTGTFNQIRVIRVTVQ
jgi:uncharacterized repeat protein (TIGR01451 family)